MPHRLMDTQQVHALGFRGRARRTCRECLTTLHRRGLAVRFEPQHGGLGGGRSGFVSMRAVADETGLPYNKVSQYVTYDQLIPELKSMVDAGRIDVPVALRAQRAASVSGDPDPDEAVMFADDMATMSGAQQKR